MTIAGDKVLVEINRYIDAMREQGKMPSAVYITKKQFEDLKISRGKTLDKNWKPRIRTIPVEIIK